MNIYRERMQNVVRALAETPYAASFDMNRFGHWGSDRSHCGTPACALGHYAYRTDLQDVFTMRYGCVMNRDDSIAPLAIEDATEKHFGLAQGEYVELFSHRGCGGAKTTTQAIAYIEAFIERKWPKARAAEIEQWREWLGADEPTELEIA